MTTKVKGSSFTFQDNANYVNVIEAGAKGDGTTDDTAAFNTALGTGLPVFVPAGTYIVQPITVPANSIVFGTGALSVIKLKAAQSSAALILGSGTVIRDVKIDGNKANQSTSTAHGISIVNAVMTQLHSVDIINTYGDGINISGASTVGVRIRGGSITGFLKNGVLVEAGTNILMTNLHVYSSDVVASPGDGISLAPTLGGASIGLVSIVDCISRSNAGKGIYIAGFGSKNVGNVSIKGALVSSNTGHGIHLITTQQIFIGDCISKSNGGDGFRLEGDTVYCRINGCMADGNTGFGMREIVAGSTPNNTTMYYNVALNNTAANTITKVGASSVVV